MENFPSNFVEDFLSLHNDYRDIHGSPPLRIDDRLNEPAQEWADVLAKRGVLEYRSDPNYGENIFTSFWRDVPAEIKPRDPLEFWYREGSYFRYEDDDVKDVEAVRHFTQLIWKNTELIGLGMAKDESGKVYFVCVYYPPGNVAGEFAKNVSPPVQEMDQELPKHEAKMIQTVKSDPKVIRSMERLYAVPSEKLRVWSIWLTKIGEIADEWQRWLRAHIDLALRLAEQLRAAEGIVEETEEKEEVEAEVTAPEEKKVLTKADDVDQEILKARSEIYPSTVTIVTDDVKAGATREEEAKEGEDAKEGEEAQKEEEEKEKEKEEEEEPIWPLGSPWIHLGVEDEDDTEPFERLPLPRNEEEMRGFLKKFTHQATIYRSYYRHWKETAEQATKELACRAVIPTYLTQGKDRYGRIRRPPRPRSVSRRKALPRPRSVSRRKVPKRRPKKPQRKRRAKSDGKSPKPVPTTSKEEKVPPDPTVKATESPTAVEEDPGKLAEEPGAEEPGAEEPGAEEPAAEEPAAEEPEATKEAKEGEEEAAPGTRVASKTPSKAISKKSEVRAAEVSDLVRDCARAAEPIPYFFYLKVEPDIDIAIEHDDEEVIAADTDRESVVGASTRLFFNLTDKPCKGGKPWIL